MPHRPPPASIGQSAAWAARWPALRPPFRLAAARVVKWQDEAGKDARRAAFGAFDAEALDQLHHRHVRLLSEDLHHLQFAAALAGVARNHLHSHLWPGHVRVSAVAWAVVRYAPPRLEDGAERPRAQPATDLVRRARRWPQGRRALHRVVTRREDQSSGRQQAGGESGVRGR